MNLNKEQQDVVNHRDGPCLVISCPGSGKTRCITVRVKSMIEEGIDPSSILSITFTNKAAKEMKERIASLMGDEVNCFVGTFHAFCISVLKKFGSKIGYNDNFSIIDTDDQIEAIAQSARLIGVDLDKEKKKAVSYAVNNLREQDKLNYDDLFDTLNKNEELVNVAFKYLEYLKTNQLIDFSGILYEAYKLVIGHQDVLDAIHRKFHYYQVDEVQDTNYIQFKFIEAISSKNRNLLMIGDDAQSIYSFRGARVENIHDYLKTYPDCKVINLSKNYRSTPQIIELAKKIISQNDDKLDFEFEATNESGSDVKVKCLNDPDHEAALISKTINTLVDSYGYNKSDIVILYRINAMSQPIEQALVRDGIPYKVVGNRSFYDRKEIKDCIAMLKLKDNPKDAISFYRLYKVIPGLGEKTFIKIETDMIDNDIDVFTALKKYADLKPEAELSKKIGKFINSYDFDCSQMTISEIYNKLINSLNYIDYLEKTAKDSSEFEDRNENIKQLILAASDFGYGLNKYLNMLLLTTASDEETEENKVTLMSLHACKGLEFPVVFMIGMEEGILPHKLSMDSRKKVNEERRLAYVGVTRAKELLFISYCKYRKIGNTKYNKISTVEAKKSRFLSESGY